MGRASGFQRVCVVAYPASTSRPLPERCNHVGNETLYAKKKGTENISVTVACSLNRSQRRMRVRGTGRPDTWHGIWRGRGELCRVHDAGRTRQDKQPCQLPSFPCSLSSFTRWFYSPCAPGRPPHRNQSTFAHGRVPRNSATALFLDLVWEIHRISVQRVSSFFFFFSSA